jgi:hypothetical protein
MAVRNVKLDTVDEDLVVEGAGRFGWISELGSGMERAGIEPATFGLQSRRSPN